MHEQVFLAPILETQARALQCVSTVVSGLRVRFPASLSARSSDESTLHFLASHHYCYVGGQGAATKRLFLPNVVRALTGCVGHRVLVHCPLHARPTVAPGCPKTLLSSEPFQPSLQHANLLKHPSHSTFHFGGACLPYDCGQAQFDSDLQPAQ